MKILKTLDPKNLLFFDIETARVVKELKIDTPLFEAWKYKKRKEGITDNKELISTYSDEAGLYPEFAKIICVVAGYIDGDTLITKTYNNKEEKVLLSNLNEDIYSLVGHNKKTMLAGFANLGFDTPFIQKRMIVNEVEYHDIFDGFDKKPWILDEVDLSVMWKGSSWKGGSLVSIVTALGIPSPKSDMAGYEVGDVYWNDGKKGFDRICKYCEQDVLATANLFRKLRFEGMLTIGEAVKEEIEVDPLLVSINNGGPFGAQQKIEIKKLFETLDGDEREQGLLILEAVSNKKGSRVTKKYIEELKATVI